MTYNGYHTETKVIGNLVKSRQWVMTYSGCHNPPHRRNQQTKAGRVRRRRLNAARSLSTEGQYRHQKARMAMASANLLR